MLKPQTSATRDLVAPRWSVAIRPRRRPTSPSRGPRALVTPLEAPVPASYNDLFVDPRHPRPRRLGLVPAHRAGPARLGGRARRPPRGRGHPRGRRLRRTTCSSPSTSAATRRSRRTSPITSRPGEEFRLTIGVEQRADERHDPARASIEVAADGRAQADVPARLLQLRGSGPLGLAVQPSRRAHRRHHGGHRPRRHDGHRRLRGRGRGRLPPVRVTPARRLRRRWSRHPTVRSGTLARRRRARCGSPAPPTSTTSRSSSSTTASVVDSYRLPVGIRTRRGARRRVPHQRRAVLLHRLRQARGHRRPRQGPRRCLPRPRLRAHGLDRRQLLPHLALPVRRGGPGVRRPARHRRHRRDRRPSASTSASSAASRAGPSCTTFSPETINDASAGRPRPGASASSSPATRTTRAS